MDSQKDKLESLLHKAREMSWNKFGKKIYFYIPSFVHYKSKYAPIMKNFFPSISITGTYCALKCKHCEGKLLRTMFPANSPEKLLEICLKIKKSGGAGCLISGGCLSNGRVPLKSYIETIAFIKRNLDLKIVVHTGLVDLETAKLLKEAGVDAALIDIIGSDETIRDVYRLNASVHDFEDSLKALKMSGIPYVPHVLVGLHYGRLKGEYSALRMISKFNPSALTIIVFFPIKGTAMENVKPPPPTEVAKIIAEARLLMPDVPISLGCARPKRKHRMETDILAVRAGVNAIAFPHDLAIKEAEKEGLKIFFSSVCCSNIFLDVLSTK